MPAKIKIRLKKGGYIKPFVSQVSRDGAIQRAFAATIGEPVGNCVAGAVHEGMSGGEIHDAVRECAKRAPPTIPGFTPGGKKKKFGRGVAARVKRTPEEARWIY